MKLGLAEVAVVRVLSAGSALYFELSIRQTFRDHDVDRAARAFAREPIPGLVRPK